MLTYDIVSMRFKQKKKKEEIIIKNYIVHFVQKNKVNCVHSIIKTAVARKKNNICSQAFLGGAYNAA